MKGVKKYRRVWFNDRSSSFKRSNASQSKMTVYSSISNSKHLQKSRNILKASEVFCDYRAINYVMFEILQSHTYPVCCINLVTFVCNCDCKSLMAALVDDSNVAKASNFCESEIWVAWGCWRVCGCCWKRSAWRLDLRRIFISTVSENERSYLINLCIKLGAESEFFSIVFF